MYSMHIFTSRNSKYTEGKTENDFERNNDFLCRQTHRQIIIKPLARHALKTKMRLCYLL